MLLVLVELWSISCTLGSFELSIDLVFELCCHFLSYLYIVLLLLLLLNLMSHCRAEEKCGCLVIASVLQPWCRLVTLLWIGVAFPIVANTLLACFSSEYTWPYLSVMHSNLVVTSFRLKQMELDSRNSTIKLIDTHVQLLNQRTFFCKESTCAWSTVKNDSLSNRVIFPIASLFRTTLTSLTRQP